MVLGDVYAKIAGRPEQAEVKLPLIKQLKMDQRLQW
jgi:hypothetical protein